MAVAQQDEWEDVTPTQGEWEDVPAGGEWQDVPQSAVADQAKRVGKNIVSGAASSLADTLAMPSILDLTEAGGRALMRQVGVEIPPAPDAAPGSTEWVLDRTPLTTGWGNPLVTIGQWGTHAYYDRAKTPQLAQDISKFAGEVHTPARPNAGTIERFATETLPTGAGTMLTSLALAYAGRAAGLPATAAVAASSGAMGAGNAFLEAKKAGATDEVAFQHALAGYGLGMTEVVPMAKWLARTGAGGALRRAMREGTEEAIQEWVQTTGQNVSAQKLFDPERPWLQGAGESSAAGATLGTVASLLFSIGGRKGRFAERPRKAPTPDQDLAFEAEGETPTPPAAVPAGTAATPPVPDAPQALAEQFRLAADPKSTRAAALVTPGATAPAVP